MKTILNDLVTELQSTTFTVDIPDENILDAYPVDVPSFENPYIIINEIDNSVYINTFTHQEEHSVLSYEFEIYCRQMTISGEVKPARYVAFTIATEIDSAVSSAFGLVRSFAPIHMPYPNDPSVSRYILTYEVVLDLTNDYLYRR